MSAELVSIIVSIFKKIVVIAIFITVILPILSIAFAYIKTMISILPRFVIYYVSECFTVVLFKTVKNYMGDFQPTQ